MTIRVGVLTVSDRCSAGVEQDASGPLICELVVDGLGAEVLRTAIVPDEQPQITATLLAWCDQGDLDLLLTTGGTGFAPRDVTPEATLAVIERPTPGLPEAMRAAGAVVEPDLLHLGPRQDLHAPGLVSRGGIDLGGFGRTGL